ncbi:MAG: mycofactocin-associated electron transfer flavoprotein alpha subunit [Microthrixaceae bacterium]
MSDLLALVPVRAGVLPAGGAEAVAEAGGRALVVGAQAAEAAAQLAGIATELRVWETPGYAPGEWATRLSPVLAVEHLVLLPGSPDGRDLAAVLDRPLFAGAMELRDSTVTTVRHGGRVLTDHVLTGPSVVTLQPGMRGVLPDGDELPPIVPLDLPRTALAVDVADPILDELLPPDVSTMDLSEAPRILGGGAGLESAARFVQLAEVAASLDASMGATRVITDRGWLDHHRQIGTTGVVVDPRLYLAFGISGAVQHTAGLGHPDHVVSINVDPHCPMMELADLAVVADANATLDALAARLGTPVSTAATASTAATVSTAGGTDR